MDPSVRPVLIGLTQSLVFRRARRVVFGYVDSTMKDLNQRWRVKVQPSCAHRSTEAECMGVRLRSPLRAKPEARHICAVL
jgi:hypothetical protein